MTKEEEFDSMKWFSRELITIPELPKIDKPGQWTEIKYSLKASQRHNFSSILDALTDGLLVVVHTTFEGDEEWEYFTCEFEDGWGKWRKS